MSNMSYCRHENTYNDLSEVWDKWVDANGIDRETGNFANLNNYDYEIRARRGLIQLVVEMYEDFVDNGIYDPDTGKYDFTVANADEDEER